MMEDLLLRRREMIASKKQLPYDAKIEYLESSGTQYIDTGIPVMLNENISITFQYVGNESGNLAVFGVNPYSNTASRLALLCSPSLATPKISIMFGAKNKAASGIVFGDAHTVIIKTDTGEFSIDNSAFVSTAGTFTYNGDNIYLFGANRGGTVNSPGSSRIFSIEIGSRMNLIPVRIGQVGYMYDRVSGRLFGNAGTGDFILGPDIN